MYSFAGLIRRTPPSTSSDTAITDRHSDTTIFQLRAHWVGISWSIGSEKSFGHVPPVGDKPSTHCMNGEHPIHWTRRSARKLLSHKKKYACAFVCMRFLPYFDWSVHISNNRSINRWLVSLVFVIFFIFLKGDAPYVIGKYRRPLLNVAFCGVSFGSVLFPSAPNGNNLTTIVLNKDCIVYFSSFHSFEQITLCGASL